MPSPFPRMAPYLEQTTVWHDFHERLIPMIAEMIGHQVRSHYRVRIEEHVYIHELPAGTLRRLARPDVAVVQRRGGADAASTTAVLDAPSYIQLPIPSVDEERLSYIVIRDSHDKEVVTIIEVLSPSNKQPGGDRDQYVAKRDQILASGVHLVEIDLLRGGPRLPAMDMPVCDYCVVVSRVEDRPRAAFWPVNLRERLPEVPIPLRAGHQPALLDLQRALSRVYDAALYEDDVYSGQPEPPLDAGDAAWAAEILREAGIRS